MAAAARKAPPLADRVATAIAHPTTSGELIDLLTEARRTLADVIARHKREEEAILDPLTRSEEAQAARDALERLVLERRRWDAAVTRLEERQKVVRAEERQREHQAAIDEWRVFHDAAAHMLCEMYPDLVRKMVVILDALAKADGMAAALTRSGATLPTVEQTVRGVRVDGVVGGDNYRRSLTILANTRIVPMEPTMEPAWPRSAARIG